VARTYFGMDRNIERYLNCYQAALQAKTRPKRSVGV